MSLRIFSYDESMVLHKRLALWRELLYYLYYVLLNPGYQWSGLDGKMTIGRFTDSLGNMNFETMLDWVGERCWKNYIRIRRLAGCDGVLSIEHEDRMLGTREGIQKSTLFLKSIILCTLPV
jgi:hypothetical protein